MAITICPECKEKISNTASVCIHCGCNLCFCPECGMAVIEGSESCPECGRILNRQESSERILVEKENELKVLEMQESKSKLKNIDEVFGSWNTKRLPFKIIGYIAPALPTLAVLFLVGACVAIAIAGNLLIIGILLAFLSFCLYTTGILIPKALNLVEWKSFYKYASSDNYPLQEAIVEAANERLKYAGYALASYYCEKNMPTAAAIALLEILKSVLRGITFGVIVLFGTLNYQIFSNLYENIQNIFNLSLYNNLWLFVVALTLFIISIVVGIIGKIFKRSQKSWIKEKLDIDISIDD